MKVLAIDQGTTATKAFTLEENGAFIKVAHFEHAQIYPQAGWVEHDPLELLTHVKQCIARAGLVDAIGIANQGETVVAWDRETKRPLYNAIVWQDDRTKPEILRLKLEGFELLTLARAGLALDPYFSASKMRWIIDNVVEAKQLLAKGRLLLGTSDTFFLDCLTGEFATDVTTASRTSLMSLETCDWDDDLCAAFKVPRECLAQIRSTSGYFGTIHGAPITASLVDQQAALYGHGGVKPGDTKITFGTGAFALAISGHARPPKTTNGLTTTIAWRNQNQPTVFAREGGVYHASSAVNWARKIGLFDQFSEIDTFAKPSAISRGLVFVPALSGLACPHWDRSAAGLWIGLGLDTTKEDMAQSILEGIAFRSAEIMAEITVEVGPVASICIDGGLANNAYFINFLAQVLATEIRVADTPDVTALGTARMALTGLGQNTLPNLPAPRAVITPDRPLSDAMHMLFSKAVSRAKGWREI